MLVGHDSDFSSVIGEITVTWHAIWMSTVQSWSQLSGCIVNSWQTVKYLIFAVSSQILHLRFCCSNTGKQNLRKQKCLTCDMTNIHTQKMLSFLSLSSMLHLCLVVSDVQDLNGTPDNVLWSWIYCMVWHELWLVFTPSSTRYCNVFRTSPA